MLGGSPLMPVAAVPRLHGSKPTRLASEAGETCGEVYEDVGEGSDSSSQRAARW